MAKFVPERTLERIRDATDIVELISQYVALKRKGREFAGLCPFHDDKRPSLTVSPTKQLFKCFACGAGGGVFQFLMLYEKHSFPEAVRALAERARIPLPAASAARSSPVGSGFEAVARRNAAPSTESSTKIVPIATSKKGPRLRSPIAKTGLGTGAPTAARAAPTRSSARGRVSPKSELPDSPASKPPW